VIRLLRLGHINLSKELRGGEVQTLGLVRALATQYSQRLIVRRSARLHRRLEAQPVAGVDVVPVANSIFAATAAATGIDLLHVHEGRSVQVGALRSLTGTPFIVTRRVLKRPRDEFATRWIYSRASAVVGVSEAVSVVMRSYVDPARVETIVDFSLPMAIDADQVARLKDRLRGRFVVGHVGALDDPHKGQRVILEAARLALEHAPEVYFLLVGGGRDEAILKDEARDLPNVEFVGQVDNVGDYYGAMDLFVFPSRDEALGSAILEAMSCRLPVIGSAIGGIPEVVKPGVSGALFESGDAAGMFAAIMRVMRDPALAAELADGAEAMARSRGIDVGARSYAEIYSRVLGR
jgi:glycosyltransferase involved in cell wall biosynthesis